MANAVKKIEKPEDNGASFKSLAMDKANAAIKSSRDNGATVAESIRYAITSAVWFGYLDPLNNMFSKESGLAAFDRVQLSTAINVFNRRGIDILFPEDDPDYKDINANLKDMATTKDKYIALFEKDEDDDGKTIEDKFAIKSGADIKHKDGKFSPDAVKTYKRAISDNYGTPENFLAALDGLTQKNEEASERISNRDWNFSKFMKQTINTIGKKEGPKSKDHALAAMQAVNILLPPKEQFSFSEMESVIDKEIKRLKVENDNPGDTETETGNPSSGEEPNNSSNEEPSVQPEPETNEDVPKAA